MVESPAYGRSIIIHASLFAAFLIYQFAHFTLSAPMEIPEAIHVDLVGLPDEVKSKQTANDFTSPIEEKASPKEKVEEKVVEVPKEKPDIQSALDAIKKFKQDSAKKKKKVEEKPSEKPKALQSTKSKELLEESAKAGRKPIYGNMISQGNSLTGEISNNPVQAWGMAVVSEVKKFWELPDHLLDDGLKAAAVIHVGSDGRVTNFYITKSSDNPDFDAQVKMALSQVTFVPPPPPDLAQAALRDGITLHFPLR